MLIRAILANHCSQPKLQAKWIEQRINLRQPLRQFYRIVESFDLPTPILILGVQSGGTVWLRCFHAFLTRQRLIVNIISTNVKIPRLRMS
ncbi:hypothetical protein D0851_01840 [Marinobacter sp. Arc7-DN-1]|nr:hypothetical protein D0851_01840 [Marinobacter sp. Arc7-DN-1]